MAAEGGHDSVGAQEEDWQELGLC